MTDVPKYWKGWVDLGSDVNWEDYHGMWGKKGPDGAWYVLQFTNMIDACGRHAAREMGYVYECEVHRVSLTEVSAQAVQNVIDSFGIDWAEMTQDAQEQALVYGLISDGVKAVLHTETSTRYPKRVRAAAYCEAEVIMNDASRRNDLLDRPMNAIGTTAREAGAGNILAGLERYKREVASGGEPDQKKDLMIRLQSAPVKRVDTRKMSGECLSVQIWGTESCDRCEYKGTKECGGKNILRTGKNECGVEIGRKGI